jgi:hypothetical protein
MGSQNEVRHLKKTSSLCRLGTIQIRLERDTVTLTTTRANMTSIFSNTNFAGSHANFGMSMSILFPINRFLNTHEKQHGILIRQKEHISPPTFLRRPVIAKFRRQVFNLIFHLFGERVR